MAHSKQARKRVRQSEKRAQRNQAVRTRLKGLTKIFRKAVEEKDVEQIGGSLKEITRALDKAASKGILHHKTASRRNSRLARAATAAQKG